MPLFPIKNTQTLSGSIAAGTASIIAAPGTVQGLVPVILIGGFMMQNSGTVANLLQLMAGTVELWRILGQNQGDGIVYPFPAGRELRIPAGQGVSIIAGGSANYSLEYWVENI